MKNLPLFLMLAVLTTLASACSNKPVHTISSHPPVADLMCPAEPAAPGDDATDAVSLLFDSQVLIAGRECRDALARVCAWHVARGMTDARCDAAQGAR